MYTLRTSSVGSRTLTEFFHGVGLLKHRREYPSAARRVEMHSVREKENNEVRRGGENQASVTGAIMVHQPTLVEA